MVGYDPQNKSLPKTYYGAAGALSGVITRAVAQPIDVLKIRFQLQVEPIRHGSKYSGILQATHRIVKEEGIRALWKGHIPAQGLSITYGLVQFTVFEELTKRVYTHLPSSLSVEYKPITHFVCGGFAGCLATLACQPFDVLRTRFVAQGEPKVYTSLRHACTTIVRQEGGRALYKGLLPTLVQVAPNTGLQFGFYTLFTSVWNLLAGREQNAKSGSTESLVCGWAAGLGSKVIVYPLDMIKKRLQIQGFERDKTFGAATPKYRGLVHCFRTVVQQEGVVGLYKGLSPSLVKAGVVVSISFWVYEQCLNAFILMHQNSKG